MTPVGRLRALIERHRVAAELGLGIAVGVVLSLGTAWQDGLTADSVLRGLTLGMAIGWATWFLARRRRIDEERAERQRRDAQLVLARELHDTLAGQVGIIGIQTAAARRVLATRPDEAAAALERIEQASRAANADLRRMLVALRDDEGGPPPAAPGLAQIDALVASASSDGLTIDCSVDEAARSLPDPALDQAAFRIVQEALTNVVTHAGAVAVQIRADVVADRLALAVVNDPGRSPGTGDRSGYGLVGMRERVAAFGGSLVAGPTADGGYSLEVELPIRGGSAR